MPSSYLWAEDMISKSSYVFSSNSRFGTFFRGFLFSRKIDDIFIITRASLVYA